MSRDKYILIEQTSLYRAESRYKKAYGYRGVAQKHADKLNTKNRDVYALWQRGNVPETVIVVSEREYSEMIKGKGEWKNPIHGTGKIWVAFDTPACCDPSTETYACM
jgi:hypothetical protein